MDRPIDGRTSESRNKRSPPGRPASTLPDGHRKTQKFKLAPQPKYSWQTPIAPFSDEAVARVVTLCLELEDEKLFLDAFELYSKGVALETSESIGKALLRYELQSLLPK